MIHEILELTCHTSPGLPKNVEERLHACLVKEETGSAGRDALEELLSSLC
jgi:hypothetical protein